MHSLLGREKKEEEVRFGVDLDLFAGFLPRAATMFSCVGCFWVLLSSALVAVCSFSFLSPAWIVKDQLRNHQHHHHHYNNKDSVSFGLLWHCSESLDRMYRCYTFGGLGKFAEIPSSSWQVRHQTHLEAEFKKAFNLRPTQIKLCHHITSLNTLFEHLKV